MFCTKCGTQNSDNAVFCSKCGNKFISIKTENESQKSYTLDENSTQEKSGKTEGKSETERNGITAKLGKMGVPGFRSGNKWKMGIAIFGYFWIGLILLAMVFGSNNTQTQNTNDVKKEYIDIYLFIDTVNLENKTILQRQEFYDSSIGKYIIHRAIVKDVTKNNIILSVDNRSTRIYLNVIENQKPEMLSLKKGDIITFEGMITSDTKYFEQSTSWPVFYPFSLDLFNGKIISKG